MWKRSKSSFARSARNCVCGPFCEFPLSVGSVLGPLTTMLELDLVTEPGLAADPIDALDEPVDDVTPVVVADPALDCVDMARDPVELTELREPVVVPVELVVDEDDGEALFLLARLLIFDDGIRVASIIITDGPPPARPRPSPKLRPDSPPPPPPRP